jgi:hypothetical protein
LVVLYYPHSLKDGEKRVSDGRCPGHIAQTRKGGKQRWKN